MAAKIEINYTFDPYPNLCKRKNAVCHNFNKNKKEKYTSTAYYEVGFPFFFFEKTNLYE